MGDWWWLSTEKMTVAVRLEDGLVVEGPPIVKRFLGQPSKNLGAWMRKQNGFRCERITSVWVYKWGNNEKRAQMKGRLCRVIARGEMRSCLVEFTDGTREVVSYRALGSA